MGDDALGKFLVERGIVSRDAVEDALRRQGYRFPLASQCYVLGYAPERTLAGALASATGYPAVVLDECVIRLELLGDLSHELARRALILPVYEDDKRLVVAMASPEDVRGVVREMERIRKKPIELHIALEVTLARTVRACYAARKRGEKYWIGPKSHTQGGGAGCLVVMTQAEENQPLDEAVLAQKVLAEDATKDITAVDLFTEADSVVQTQSPTELSTTTDQDARAATPSYGIAPASYLAEDTQSGAADARVMKLALDLDQGSGVVPSGPPRVLIIDPDVAIRQLLVRELQPVGYRTATVTNIREAIHAMRLVPPDMVLVDMQLPDVAGLDLCAAIKHSNRLGHVPVVILAMRAGMAELTEDVLVQHRADGALEKPIDPRRLHRVVRDLVGPRGGTGKLDASFTRAVRLYQAGDIDGAVDVLKVSITSEPNSAKHRFVLANLLQRKGQINEAIDEYEAVVGIEPEYFPALTRLAYLYYKQGLLVRAVDTWRKSLPLCKDQGLRKNIELFMRKLIVDIQRDAANGG